MSLKATTRCKTCIACLRIIGCVSDGTNIFLSKVSLTLGMVQIRFLLEEIASVEVSHGKIKSNKLFMIKKLCINISLSRPGHALLWLYNIPARVSEPKLSR